MEEVKIFAEKKTRKKVLRTLSLLLICNYIPYHNGVTLCLTDFQSAQCILYYTHEHMHTRFIHFDNDTWNELLVQTP